MTAREDTAALNQTAQNSASISTGAQRILSGKIHSVSIPCFEVYSGGGSEYAIYRILIEGQRGAYLVYRRYSHFHALLGQLNLTDTDIGRSFPAKSIFGNLDEAFLQQRRASLQYFLISIIENSSIMNLEGMKKFLDPSYECSGSKLIFSRHIFSSSFFSEIMRQSIPKYSIKELNRLFDQNASKHIPTILDCEDFIHLCCNDLHFRSAYIAYRLYHILDTDGSLRLTFKSALSSLSIMSVSPPEQKVGFCIKIFQIPEKPTQMPKDAFSAMLMSWAVVFSPIYSFESHVYIDSVFKNVQDAGLVDAGGFVDINAYCLIATKHPTTKKILSHT